MRGAAWVPAALVLTLLAPGSASAVPDTSAPDAPRELHVQGGRAWRSANRFELRWKNPRGQETPIVAADYRICRPGSDRHCAKGEHRRTGIDSMVVQVPREGAYGVVVWLIDKAGNGNRHHASLPMTLRLDRSGPRSPGFVTNDPSAPSRVLLPYSDDLSGPASAAIEISGPGTGGWRSLPTQVGAGLATATLPDLELADGTYALRGRLTDRAGNAAVTTGGAARLVLPVRARTAIIASAASSRVARSCRATVIRVRGRATRRLVCRTVPAPFTWPFGQASPSPLARLASVAVHGALVTSRGGPVAGASVSLWERARTEPLLHPVGSVLTDAAGGFALDLPPGPSRVLRLSYAGGPTTLASMAETSLLAPAAATLAASRRLLRNGQVVAFAGALAGSPHPEGGRTVDLQAFYRGAWRTFATPRTDGAGRWRYAYRFGATRGRVRYAFRVVVQRDAAYPYELGYSPVVSVLVIGRG